MLVCYIDENNIYHIKEPPDVSPILGITVYQFDNKKNYLKTFKNIKEASRESGISEDGIRKQIHHLRKTDKIITPYYWRAKEDVKESEEKSGSFIMLR